MINYKWMQNSLWPTNITCIHVCEGVRFIKVPLRSKFCIPFFLQLLKVEVINTYHAKFYIEIPTGRPVILNVKFIFAVPPLLERQMAVNYIESWI